MDTYIFYFSVMGWATICPWINNDGLGMACMYSMRVILAFLRDHSLSNYDSVPVNTNVKSRLRARKYSKCIKTRYEASRELKRSSKSGLFEIKKSFHLPRFILFPYNFQRLIKESMSNIFRTIFSSQFLFCNTLRNGKLYKSRFIPCVAFGFVFKGDSNQLSEQK